MGTQLDDILGDDEPSAPATPEKPEPAAAAEPAEPAAPVQRATSKRQEMQDKEMDAQGFRRDPETGQFLPKEAAPAKPAEAAPAAPVPAATAAPAAVPAQPEMTEKEKAFLRATQEERAKRQELERRLAALESAKQGQPAATPEAKSFWDDPEGFFAKQQAEQRREVIGSKLQISETFARQRHTDFDEKIATFSELLQKVPGLSQQWLAQADPAEFAYATAKSHMELAQAGSIEELRAKIERETTARVRAQVEAELKAKADELAKQRAELTPSLTEARSTGSSRPVYKGPTPLDDIIAP